MRFKTTFTQRANEDLRGILSFYDNKESGTSQKFIIELIESIDVLETHPKAFPLAFSTVRKMVLPKFPFNIFYTIFEDKQQIIIARIWHQKRNPTSFKMENS